VRGKKMSGRRRRRVEPTDDWEQLKLMCKWPEQVRYEEIRPLALFGSSVVERAEETGTSERTLYRRVDRFEAEGMESLFGAEATKHRRLPPAFRRLIVDLKAEYPHFSLNEIAKICYACFGRTPSGHTVKRVLEEEPLPLRMIRRYPPYREIAEARERRLAVVTLHSEGWTVKAIAGYLKINRDTVYRTLKRWIEEGEEGLDDRPGGRPKGVRKVTLAAMDAIRRMQKNPNLGEFRIHAALAQIGIHLSPRTCGRILALNRELYGLEKPKGARRQPKGMPFATTRRHRYWTADVRYLDVVDEHLLGSRAYAITVLENHSRAILASAVSPTQDLASFLSVFYAAVERYGSPEALVTDGGSIFRANQAKAIYEALGIRKEEIERGKPWQSYVETTFNIQRRMADWHFAEAATWPELVATHDAWVENYNAQNHWAHRERRDGRRSPREVLGWLTGVRYRKEDLERAFFAVRFSRVLDALGYARFRDWRLYGEEGLARKQAAIWLQSGSLTIEHGGEPLSRYDVELVARTGELKAIGRARLYETSHRRNYPQLRVFALEEAGWIKALKLDGYAPRGSRQPRALQVSLFPFLAGTGA
jgi:putative transposase